MFYLAYLRTERYYSIKFLIFIHTIKSVILIHSSNSVHLYIVYRI